jgi:hypothetical protein
MSESGSRKKGKVFYAEVAEYTEKTENPEEKRR